MTTITAELPESTHNLLRRYLGGKQSESAFVRETIEARLREMREDEEDIRDADEIMARIERGESKPIKAEDVWRELGI